MADIVVSKEVSIPNFEFSAFYYPQLLDALLAYKRINVPELTDESPEEPSIQFVRMFALVGHLNNVVIDIIANESTLPTAQLPETIRNMLRLIGYELRSASPSQVEMIYQLSKVFTTSFGLVPQGSQASTPRGDGTQPVVFFETLDGLTIQATDVVDSCLLTTLSPPFFLDKTSQANSGAGFSFDPSDTREFYIGNLSVMWDKMNIEVLTPLNEGVLTGVWEFFDGDYDDTAPDNIAVSSVLTFEVNDLLGAANRAGATVRVMLNVTGAFEDCIATWNGSANVIATTGLLGQSSPSSTAADYTVGTAWQELDNVDDGTELFTQTGDVSFTLPQTSTRNWKRFSDENPNFYVRFRVITLNDPNIASIGKIDITVGKQYAIATATQGRTVPAETLGSSNGSPNQKFTTSQTKFIFGSESLRVDAETWTRVTNFLNSEAQDKHYVIELGEEDRATIKFGNGVNGKIPPIGVNNVVMDYRNNAADNGNVGANTITVDKQGLTFVEKIWNPRQAVGWAEAQSASPAALEQAKEEGPATLRTKEVAVGPDDVVDLTIAFTDSAGSKPFSRAKAIEEAFGPKTIGVVCVARGGSLATPEQLDALDTYFNGDKTVVPPLPKHLVANQEATALNFTPRTIDVTATVYGPADITSAEVINRLTAQLQPEAFKEDGVTYLWDFGGEVPKSRIEHEIFLVDPRIRKVVLTGVEDVLLGARELPVPGSFVINVIATT